MATRRRGKVRDEPLQRSFTFRTWGGRRAGAGRRRSKRSGVPHHRRPPLASRYPIHVTLKIRGEIDKLRSKKGYRAIRRALVAGCAKEGFRVCHFSLQNRHVHLIVEAKGAVQLSRGIQGLKIRMARGINRAYGRSGPVFADRYHAHILRTPREVHSALGYVLNNGQRHQPIRDGEWALLKEDPFSSAAWFDGWRRRGATRTLPTGPPPVAAARSWLLTTGWRRHGLLLPAYLPPKRRQSSCRMLAQ